MWANNTKQSDSKQIEASGYASGAKIHLVFLWLLTHGLNLEDTHKANIRNEIKRTNQSFIEQRKRLTEPRAELRRIDESDTLDTLEHHSMLRSFPPNKFGKRVIEYSINAAFFGDLIGVPGFFFHHGIFRLNLPKWKDGLVKPYCDDENKIIGLFLYQNINALPKMFSSHNLLLGKKFIEPMQMEGIFLE